MAKEWVKRGNLKGPKGDVGDWGRGSLTVNDDLDDLFAEGKWSILSSTVATAVGSPISPFATVEVLGIGASAIQRVAGTEEDPRKFERGTTPGGASWGEFRRTDHDTKIVLHQLSNPSNGSLNEVAPSRHVRLPLKLGAQADGFRLYFRNYNDRESKNYAGDLTFTGIFIGKRAKDSFGLYTEDFAEAPVNLGLPSRTTLSDGSYRWAVATKYFKLEANAEYLISYGYTTASGQVNHVGYSGAYLGTVPGAADYVDASGMTWSPTAPLDVYMTLIVPEDTPTYGYVGSSTPAGANTNHPLRDSFAWRHAYAEGAIPTILAHAGSAMTSWDSTSDWKWTKARAYARLDRMYFCLGSNDVYGAATLGELQDRNTAVAKVIRSQVADQLFYVNIAPRAAEDVDMKAKRLAYNEWLDGLPNDALATHDVASVVTGPDGSLASIYDSGDGVHMNELGQRKAAEAVIKAGGSQGTPGPAGIGFPTGGLPLQVPRINSTGTTTEFVTPTKSLVGLGNVDNTADADKPVSGPQATALGGKVGKGEQSVSPKDHGASGNGTADDTAAVIAALAAAKLNSLPMMWNGAFKTTANIPDLHNVRHRGNGYIVRDGLTFFPEPASNRKNTLYVAAGGLSTNDGLSSATPMDLQTAFNKLENYGPVLQGWWVIQLAAGTYPGGYATPYMEGARRPVEIRGVDMGGPRVAPTVIFDRGTSTTVAWAIMASNLKINFYDIDFRNFDLYDHTVDGNNSGALRLEKCDSLVWNCFIDNADFGIYALNFTKYTVQGCYIKNCQMGVTELWHVTRATSGDFANRNIIENCFYGLKAKELCTGHGDWNEYLDCDYAIHLSRSSTINASNSTFKRNGVCYVMSGYSTYVELYTVYGEGVDKNGVKVRNIPTSSMRAGAENYLSAPYIGMKESTLGYGKRAAHTGTLTDTQLVPLGTFIPGDFQGEGSWVRWEAYGTANMVSATSLLRLRVGGTTGVSLTMPAGVYDWKFEGRMYVTADGDFQQLNAVLYRSTGNPIFTRTPRTNAFSTSGFGFGLYMTLGGTTDSITVDQAFSFTSEL